MIEERGSEGGGRPEMASVLLGLGSNVGDREAHLRGALSLLERNERVEVVAVSDLVETKPVGGPPQGPFLNAAAEIVTSLSPRSLLELLLSVETSLGRTRTVRWGPREVDLDILLYGNRTLKEPGLEVPHARMLEREFVLEPLVQIAADRVHPLTGHCLKDHLERLREGHGPRPVPTTGRDGAVGKEWRT